MGTHIWAIVRTIRQHRVKMGAETTHWPILYGDPRRPNEIHPYKKPAVKEEDIDPDFKALISLALGMAGLFTKNVFCSWGALFSAVSSIITLENPEANMKQATTAVMFSLSGLVSGYGKQMMSKQ